MQRQIQGSDAKRQHEHACLGRADCPPNCVARFGFELPAAALGVLSDGSARIASDEPAVRTGERRAGPQVLDGLYCRASAAAVPSQDPHDLILAGWSAFPSADAERSR
jgi:hypothetical protein